MVTKAEFKKTEIPGDPVEYLYVDDKALKQLTFELAEKVIDSGEKPDRMVILARGGWVPGRSIIDYLQAIGLEDVATIGVKSINGINRRKQPVIYQKLPTNVEEEIKGKKVLIVEELSDTGEQLRVVSEYLKELGVEKIIMASLFRKPQSTAALDAWVEETSSWIIFAYESIETMSELYVDWRYVDWRDEALTEKMNEDEIVNRFTQIGFEERDIEFFLQHKVGLAKGVIEKRKREAEEARQLALQSPAESATVEP